MSYELVVSHGRGPLAPHLRPLPLLLSRQDLAVVSLENKLWVRKNLLSRILIMSHKLLVVRDSGDEVHELVHADLLLGVEGREFLAEWMGHTWEFSKMLVPLLFGGVFVVGFLGALIPEKQVAELVGDNSLLSNLIASVVGCFFYFATLTEVPILEALMGHGMATGPAATNS